MTEGISMDNNQKRINAMTFQWTIPILVLMGYLFVTLYNYNYTMQAAAEKKALERISRQAVYVSGYYNAFFNTVSEAANAIADDSVEEHESLLDDRQVAMLTQLVKKFGLQKGFIVKSDLSGVDSNGKRYSQVSTDETFISLIQASNSRSVYIDEKGNILMLISAPIRTEHDWWGNVIFEFKPKVMGSIINNSTYSYSMIFSDGTVAEMVGSQNDLFNVGDNIDDAFSNVTFVDGTKNNLMQLIEAGRSGSVSVIAPNGGKVYVTFQPVGDLGACIMVSVRESQVIRSIKEENKDTNALMFKIMISVGIFLALVIVIYIINRIGFAKQSKELKDKAETDLLTDLLNKVSTEKKIKEYLAGEGRDKVSMMCVLDIDNFKKINDTMGHAFGDEVLSEFGKGIKSEFRVTDIVGRTGGDEFIILLKDLKNDEIISREAERISRFFKTFQVGTYQKYSPTASIGAAIFPRDAQDYESLYKSADSALYKAKKRGKNQLAFYRDEFGSES